MTDRSRGGTKVLGVGSGQPASSARGTGIAVSLAVSVGLGLVALNVDDSRASLVLACLSFSSLALGLLLGLGSDTRLGLREFSLGYWVLAFGIGAFGISSLTLLMHRSGPQGLVNPDLAGSALAIVGLGYVAFFLGYRFGPARAASSLATALLSPRKSMREVRLRHPQALCMVYLIGVAATLAKIAVTGGFGYVGGADVTAESTVSGAGQILTILASLRTVAVLALTLSWSRSKRSTTVVPLLICVSLECLIALLGGVKEFFVVTMLACFIPLAIDGARRLPTIRIASAMLVFIFVVTPFVTSLRAEVRGESRASVGQSVQLGWDSLINRSFLSTDSSATPREDPALQVMSRLRLLDNIIIIVDKTPSQYAYREPAELLAAPIVGLIPRAVWPEKPIRLTGLEFYKTYYRGQGVSSSAPTFQGSLYLYGGVLPVAAGMVLFGVALRGIDDAKRLLVTERSAVITLILFVGVVKQELDAASILAAIPAYLVAYYLSTFCISRPDRGRSASSRE